mmetsp:Transcript_28211/g.47444  ORF Transcript_28211/g.47444 Transcript_28211/m.47444 type:complete len:309 (-) Transcript_28211:39-965(-)
MKVSYVSCVCSTLSFVCLLLLPGFVWLKPAADHEKCKHLMIWKFPSSGSSWFTECIDSLPGIDIKQELYVSKNAGVSRQVILKEMDDYLSRPCAKVTGFSQHIFHDVLTTSNFSFVNLAHTQIKHKHPIYLLIWSRTNVVQRTLSIMSTSICGSHNTKSESAAKACSELTYRVDIKKFVDLLVEYVCHLEDTWKIARDFAEIKPVYLHEMQYEDFVMDPAHELEKMYFFLGLTPDAAIKSFRADKASRYQKRSAKNVTSMVQNVADLELKLRHLSLPGLPLLEMLHDVENTKFRIDYTDICKRLKSQI